MVLCEDGLFGSVVSVWASGSYAIFAPTSVWNMCEVMDSPFFCIWFIWLWHRFARLYNLLIVGSNTIFGFAVQYLTNFGWNVCIINVRPPIIFPFA